MIINFTKRLFTILLFTSISFAQNYEIKFDSLNASGWFGGNNRPGQQRNVAVAQSVLITEPITLETFAFYFTVPFDSAINGLGTGHEVTLKLHIRDSVGTVLQTEQIIVPDTFIGGWVSWSGINLNLTESGKYIFSAYLVGGYDSNEVYSGIGCDLNAGYLNGDMYVKYVTNDLEAETWVDWSQHVWDANFWLTRTVIPTNIEDKNQSVRNLKLEQNYPNPFNPSTNIQYAIGPAVAEQFVTLKVYDVLGNEIATLVNREKPAGSYKVTFNASDFPSGIYFYQLTAGSFVQSKKMLLVK
ncbi:T9SS type A sorting domain-containing protein [Ignavibacterium album]|uniref:T9SS type A sorting domain-containing protein n=1 Tax=Ignavibacterium album TaxID=591197 RepID=UPI0026E976D6|nr:T9SS type A sorting domain-containing protein [Ignavibacterium album]